MIEAGCELIRITTPSKKEAQNLQNIKDLLSKKGYRQPLIADVHYTPNAAEIAANSAGTNRIVKRLISDRFESPRVAALLNEREMPHGRPDDMADRMRSGGR